MSEHEARREDATGVWYAVYRVSDGALRSSGESLSDRIPPGYDYNEYETRPPEHWVWDASLLDYVEPDAPVKIRTRSELMELFLDPELDEIYGQEGADPLLHVYLEWFRSALQIPMDHPKLVEGLNYCETSRYIGAGRAQVILDS